MGPFGRQRALRALHGLPEAAGGDLGCFAHLYANLDSTRTWSKRDHMLPGGKA